MDGSRSRYGVAISALGAITLAVAVFLPWYGLRITAQGAALAQQAADQIVSQYGNAALQSQAASLHAHLSGVVGHELGSLSAHQALSTLNVVLLVVAALGCAIALLALAGPPAAASDANRVPLGVLGALAAVCVFVRIIHPPTPAGQALALSPREGAWLALLGALAILAGAVWPRGRTRVTSGDDDVRSALASLSGWTPQA
jgi:hypothetical protein